MSGTTQRQALNAIVFLYKNVMDMPLDGEIAPIRSKRLASPPTVLTQVEVQRLLASMEGKTALMAKLLYGSGLRLMECICLRGKDGTDRMAIPPQKLCDELQAQINVLKSFAIKNSRQVSRMSISPAT